MTSGGQGGQAAQGFHALAEAVIDDLLARDPVWATSLGEHRFDHLMPDLGADGRAAERAAVAGHRAAVASVDPARLPVGDAVDREILLTALDARLLELDVLREDTWNPLAWNFGDAVYYVAADQTRPAADRLEALAGRLDALPDLLALAPGRLGPDVPRVHAETAAQQNDGTIELLVGEVARLLEAEPGLRARVEPPLHGAVDALQRHGSYLRDLRHRANGGFRLGADRFAARLRLTLDAELTPDQLLDQAWDHVAQVRPALVEVSRRLLGPAAPDGDDAAVAAAMDHCASRRPDDATVVDRARTLLAGAMAATAALGVVTVPADPLDVEVMPEFRRGVAVAYCDPPGPLQAGGRTRFAIAPPPREWPAERRASFYREFNDANLVDLVVHEAVPGHWLQLAHARRHRAATRVRRVFWNGPFVEGWAVHAERIMAEAGYGGLPVRLQQLKMQVRVALNAIVDVSVHAGDLDEAGALALLTGTGWQEPGEAYGKWRRAQLTSTQLSTYFAGYAALADLLDRRPATRYDDLLAHGSPPVRHLDALLDAAG